MRTALLLGTLACGPTPSDPAIDPTPAASQPVADAPDPFAGLEEPDTALTDISPDLQAVLENGTLRGACSEYAQDPGDRAKLLKCGKYQFFYENFGGQGPPAAIFDFLSANFPNEIGDRQTGWGLIPDPYSDRPLGFPNGVPLSGGSESVVFGCASCHFAQLPDGRYAVGAANLDYDYGAQMMAIQLVPASIAPGFQRTDHHADAIADLEPILDTLAADSTLQIQFGLSLLGLLSEAQLSTPTEIEGQYANWRPGTMDFATAPLTLDDEVHTISRILPLWDLPTAERDAVYGATSGQLGWTGAVPDTMSFIVDFSAGFGQAVWPENRLRPLEAYLLSLRSPANPNSADEATLAAGRQVFDTAGCLECHQGHMGSSIEPMPFEDVGTEDALVDWGSPEDGAFCCGLGEDGRATPTGGIKSPRLGGLWAQSKLLHNGSIDSLEQLLCLEARPNDPRAIYSSDGHEQGCELPRTNGAT